MLQTHVQPDYIHYKPYFTSTFEFRATRMLLHTLFSSRFCFSESVTLLHMHAALGIPWQLVNLDKFENK